MAPDRRRIRSVLSGPRLLTAVVLVLALPVGLSLTAASYTAPAPPPPPVTQSHASLPQLPDSVARAELDRSAQADRLGREIVTPQLLEASRIGVGNSALPTLVLARREAPYTLAELQEQVPVAFSALAGEPAVLVNAHINVPLGATLVLDGRTPEVRLVSSPAGFATLISRGTVRVSGSAAAPVRVSSWNPQQGAPDADSTDGRSFVLQLGGRMDTDHGVFEHLGFGTGISSGMAWRGAGPTAPGVEPIRAQGEVTSSVFAHNHFGAYTHDAQGMRWVGDTFAHNEEYGFDPHDLSNDFLVEGNLAHHNGRHGFIFSRGTDRNVMRGNTAHDNAGHGFMIDDGRSEATSSAERRVDPADDNLVIDNIATNNGLSGIEIEGGTGNVVSGNQLTGNYIGVRVNNGGSAAVRDNTIIDSYRYGVDVLDSAGRIPVSGNTISGSWAAISLATADAAVLADNSTSDVSTPLVVDGVAERSMNVVERVAQFLRWNPMLVLWGLVLGVPVVVALARPGLRIRRAVHS